MEMYWVIKASLELIFVMASMVVMSSANCPDPGFLAHGSRFVFHPVRRPMDDGTTISFSCDPNYALRGAKKIMCIKGRWNGKKPICKASGCPLPPPPFPNANQKSQTPQNTIGSYVEYECNKGYTSEGRPTKILCDKDHDLQGYSWNGNITCEKIRCGPPPKIAHSNVTTSHNSDGTITYATYHCFSGYAILDFRDKLQPSFVMSCDEGQLWGKIKTPKCVKTCRTSDVKIDHGILSEPRYITEDEQKIFTENETATFSCERHYKLEGNSELKCMESGLWSDKAPRCVINICTSPGDIEHGRVTFDNHKADQTTSPIGTVARFRCNVGFKLVGNSTRQCQPGGHWSGQRTPICQKSMLKCEQRDLIDGEYQPKKANYFLHDKITPHCKPDYYLWGPPSLTCSDFADSAVWLYPGCNKDVSTELFNCNETPEPECVTSTEFDKKCENVGGSATLISKKGRDSMICEKLPEEPDVPDDSQRPNRELDKMTIVIASTGSTLGALVVLLAALYCFRQRIRRLRRPSYRSRRYSDDDRIAFIAYAGDVHFILPSYDEAMSQVERSPPPFESVVGGAQGSANRSTTDRNGNQSTNQSGNTGLNHTATSTNPATEGNDLRTAHELAQGQSIRVVSNPLAENVRDTICSSTTQNVDHVSSSESTRRIGFSDERACVNAPGEEPSPNRPSEDIPSCSSEEDLTSNQTQPLLPSSRSGVMA
ncbi:complement component receptor 1-like protein [Pocillopora verrucosa]|uniref:complement component receptor 1-like protein n=1 Tax=Pocillopora verrucosa TaxID=203993 RepID=UPI003341FE5C